MFRNLLAYARKRPKPVDVVKKWKIVKGDTVQVIRGKDSGKKGIVTRVLRNRNRLVVEGLNLVKKHVKPSDQNKGGILTKESPIHLSNVGLIDPQDGKPCRVRWGFLPATQRNVGEFTKKGRVRLSRRSNSIIPRPVTLGQRKKPKPKDGPKDTAPGDVLQKTYVEPDYVELVKKSRQSALLLQRQKRKRVNRAVRQKFVDAKTSLGPTGLEKVLQRAGVLPQSPRRVTMASTIGAVYARPQAQPPQPSLEPKQERAKMEGVD